MHGSLCRHWRPREPTMEEGVELLCTDCVHYPEPRADVEASAPDRIRGGQLSEPFYCPRIQRWVSLTWAVHCPEFEEAALEEEERGES